MSNLSAKEIAAISGSITTLAALTAATPDMIISNLEGVLFTKSEADGLRRACRCAIKMFDDIIDEMMTEARRTK